jgi:polysaccharide chain length determinant protein (PEP-CTERM system associated)
MNGLYDQIRIAIHQVWTRRWLALGVAWGLCLAGWLAIALIPNSYESKARVFAQEQSILPQQVGMVPNDRQADLLRLKQALTSTENLQKVVRRTDLNLLVGSEADMAAQVAKLRENIKITAQIDNPNMIEISATTGVAGFSNAQNARTASGTVQALLDLFIEENLAGGRAETGQSLGFLDEELKRRELKLQEAEQRRVEFETRYLGVLPGEGSIEQRMSSARMELANIDQQLAAAQGALASIRAQLNATPANISTPGFSGGGGGGFATQQLATLQGTLAQQQARGFTENHPDVIATRNEISRLRPQAQSERSAGGGSNTISTPNPAYSSLRAMAAEREATVNAASMRKNQLQAAMTELSAKQSSEPGVVAEQARLNRDYEVLKRQYDKLLEDREQVRLRSDIQTKTDAMQVKVIDPPSKPTSPIAPNRPLFLTGILLVAIGAGVGAAFAKGQLQTTFPTVSRLEQATGLPVLGSVSQIFTPERRAKHRQRMKWFAGAGGALAGSYALLMLVEFWQRSTVA